MVVLVAEIWAFMAPGALEWYLLKIAATLGQKASPRND